MKAISQKHDDENKKTMRQFAWIPGFSRRHIHDLLENGSPEARDEYVLWGTMKITIMGFAVAVIIWVSFIPPKEETRPLPPSPHPELASAGKVQSIELHDTTFSRSTTVVTTDGIFQVADSVSAATGDTATLSTDKRPEYMGEKSLCIESKIKSACYRLL